MRQLCDARRVEWVNVDRRVPGLVFAGSGTTPGVGVPMVLLSGKHAAQRVQAHLTGTRR